MGHIAHKVLKHIRLLEARGKHSLGGIVLTHINGLVLVLHFLKEQSPREGKCLMTEIQSYQ